MKTQFLFEEVQKQDQKWIWFVVVALDATLVVTFLQEIVFGIPLGEQVIPIWSYAIISTVLLLTTAMLFFSKLKTTIDPSGISLQFFPFHRKPIVYTKDEIENCYVRLYRPLAEYGGWGLRTAFNGKNGKAYNVAGNIGIQLELKNGEKVLIGTRNAKAAGEAIQQLKSSN